MPPTLTHLAYRIVSRVTDHWEIGDLELTGIRLGGFQCDVVGDRLEARPLRHHEDEEAARAELEPLLDGWEASIELEADVPVRFVYGGASFAPVADEHGNITVHGGVALEVSTAVSAHAVIRKGSIPPPLPAFSEPSELRLLRERIRDYNRGRERLLALGCFAYTTFTGRYQGKRNAPTLMNVAPDVFEKLNELTSRRSDPQHGRKAIQGPPLTEDEREWVAATVKALAKRMGETEAGALVNLITMQDLPQLR